ncbi:MAG: ThiF family adenylyltransferase, partial [Candidatus Bathyarchaeota archaeon]|nr:ThiF family adenylyltransferase [Candidatus Bathyarchaeota archaeon]
MSLELISRSEDLKKLQDEGYEVAIKNGHLVISHIPYITSEKKVMYGTLASQLDLAGNKTTKPGNHVALWVGER